MGTQENTENCFSLSVSPLALGLYTVNAVYGDTITMPCRLEVPDGLMFGKWKYVSIAYLVFVKTGMLFFVCEVTRFQLVGFLPRILRHSFLWL